MPSRTRRPEVSCAWVYVLASALALLSSWICNSARAELSGEADGRALIGLDGRYGGALSLDLWGTRGMFRPGAAFGLGALSSNRHGSSRVFTPLALSLGFVPWGDERTGLVLVVRGGGYAGAQKGGLIAGAFASGSMGLAIALGEGASLRLAGEAWGLIGPHGGVFFGPTVGLGF
ncbi:MAG: hypothetical protein JWN04_1664 [Myxococcaceae bacterium]|nr:hypothetical protein [Myxococcaceae bacterium]